MSRKTESLMRQWVQDRIPKPKHCSANECKCGGSHSMTVYLAYKEPVRDEDFGNWTFHCTGSCDHYTIELSDEERARLLPLYRQFIQQTKQAAKDARAAAIVAAKAEHIAAPRKPRRKVAEEPVAPNPPAKTSAAPSKGKARQTVDAPPGRGLDITAPSKGKGKQIVDAPSGRGLDIDLVNGPTEDDGYKSDTYEIEDDERRLVQLVAFTDGNTAPVLVTLNLRAVSCFSFKAFDVAVTVNTVSSEGGPGTKYLWYCPLKNEWNSLGDGAINFHPRGRVFMLRPTALSEEECLNIDDWTDKAIKSVLKLAPTAQGLDFDHDYIEIIDTPRSSPMHPSSSAPTASSAGSSQPLKRKASSSSEFLEQQSKFLETEELEDRKFKRQRGF
ncbi:hypothetical protein B0H16DRAFT_1752481 [Mycena metata]|uniref:Uncharacterized protein n=1 Tax=Mycena metata TaxID=1033252 RepID=A0AAD7DG97_9AGAR|nr:hypothetical protein B0H16DRAFT_1752481 [Mycena metata]